MMMEIIANLLEMRNAPVSSKESLACMFLPVGNIVLEKLLKIFGVPGLCEVGPGATVSNPRISYGEHDSCTMSAIVSWRLTSIQEVICSV